MTTKTTPNLWPDQVAILSEMEAWLERLKNHDVPLTAAETIRMLDFVMRVQGFIAYSNRENRRLVRERDEVTKRLDQVLNEIKRSLIALGAEEDHPVAILRENEYLADAVARVVRERNALAKQIQDACIGVS